MQKPLLATLTLLLLTLASAVPAMAEPCAVVTSPKDLRFVDLRPVASYLEEDLDRIKGITGLIGREIIEKRFRDAGIPDPVKKNLSYSIVAAPSPDDTLNLCFIMKGDIDTSKFFAFAEKRFHEYLRDLEELNIAVPAISPKRCEIAGLTAVIFPFPFRANESVLLAAGDTVVVATVPAGQYGLIANVAKVLEEGPGEGPQPEKISFAAKLFPSEIERKEIRHFENRYEGLRNKVRKQMKGIMDKFGMKVGEKELLSLEQKIKRSLSEIVSMNYSIEARKEREGYAYDVTLKCLCRSEAHANELKELFLALLVSNASKSVTRNDLAAFKANKVGAKGSEFAYRVSLGSSPKEQQAFSAMTLSMMLQDRRFTRIFNPRD